MAATLAERMDAFTLRIPFHECWEWIGSKKGWERTGTKKGRGYGQIGVAGKGRSEGAHRVAWELANGPIPDGMWVLHRCDNDGCVRPSHLFLGDAAANAADMAEKDRVRHGVRHPYAKINDETAREFVRLYAQGVTGREIAGRFGVSEGTVFSVVLGRSWRRAVAGMERRTGGRQRGEAVHTAKLTEEKVREILRLLASGLSLRKTAHHMGVSQHAVFDIGAGRTWKHVPREAS